jgi:hypothetical protein
MMSGTSNRALFTTVQKEDGEGGAGAGVVQKKDAVKQLRGERRWGWGVGEDRKRGW